MRPRATVAWAAYLVVAAGLALFALTQWLSALVNRVPVLYGEGAVANAARLARDGIAYLDPDPSRFVAANYPPLYFHLASIVDPLITGRVASIAATLAAGGCMLLTADHGNAEEMVFRNGEPNTQHSTNPVPVAFIANDAGRFTLHDGGLVDVAPTLLSLLGLPVPARMTGRSLLDRPGT